MKELRQGICQESQKEVSVEKRMGECFSGKQPDSVQEERTSCKPREQSWTTSPKGQTQIDGRKPSKGSGSRKVFLKGKVRKRANSSLKEFVPIRRVIIGILPYVKIPYLYLDANLATNVCSDTLKLMAGPVKSRRKVVGKDQLPH